MDFTNNRTRIVTAAALFDGHDAAINIMRRILQSKGVEVIHLGHNRSVHEIVEAAIEEDAHGIAITSYQGGHVEFFKYMKDLLEENGCGHIRIFGGGGGTILPDEITDLHNYGITRIYSPDDGRKMGLEGMIEDLINKSLPPTPSGGGGVSWRDTDYFKAAEKWNGQLPLGEKKDVRKIARAITLAENGLTEKKISDKSGKRVGNIVLGITGTGGAGKSSVTDEIIRRFLNNFPDKTIAVVSVDPSKKKTGGALLGDRIRMNSIHSPRAYMRSLATRESDVALSPHVQDALDICHDAGYDFIILESAGVGQSDASILNYCDVSLYVMTPEYGAASQLEKINMLDYADIIAINKFDKAGALDALNDVRKQYKRNHALWSAKDEELPVIGTIASQFNDKGVNHLFDLLIHTIEKKCNTNFGKEKKNGPLEKKFEDKPIIPPGRTRYLSEIADSIREYDQLVKDQSDIASKLYQLHGALEEIKKIQHGKNQNQGSAQVSPTGGDLERALAETLQKQIDFYEQQLTPVSRKLIQKWPAKIKAYQADHYEYDVRGKTIRQPMFSTSLSGTRLSKVVLPKYKDLSLIHISEPTRPY